MNKRLAATAACALFAGAAGAEDIKIGIITGFTGPIESMAGPIASGSDLAIAEVNASGLLLDGSQVTAVRGDDGCSDAAAATSAAEKLVTSDHVAGILGGSCSGVTSAILANVAVPNGVVMISPSATSPGLTTADDKGLFFRTAPSDARQGEVAADILVERGFKSAALTYSNSDYGKGLAEFIQKAFEAKGGKITASIAHEDGKADYSAEVAALAAAGGDVLIVAGYADQGGGGVIRGALDSGAFSTFAMTDGMISDALTKNIPEGLNGSFGTKPGTDSPGGDMFAKAVNGAFDSKAIFAPESYDAAALMLLAMAAAKSSKPADYGPKIMDLANAPGEKIFPGELKKALEIINGGGDIDYVGASAVEMVGPGEASGSYAEMEVKDNALGVVKYH